MVVTQPLKVIQCPACGDLRVESRPCPHCEPGDPVLAALRREEQAQARHAAPRAPGLSRLLPRLFAFPPFWRLLRATRASK
jgi:hypothetical protein